MIEHESREPNEDYARAVGRMFRFAAVFTALGLLITAAIAGRAAVAGFACGAVLSVFNLWLWHRVASVAGPGLRPQQAWPLALFAARLVLLALALYVILRYLDVNALGAIAGLFSGFAAVLAESVFELIGAWRST